MDELTGNDRLLDAAPDMVNALKEALAVLEMPERPQAPRSAAKHRALVTIIRALTKAGHPPRLDRHRG